MEDDDVNEQLDEQYRQILQLMKPHIQNTDNPTTISQIRVWLEKLSNCEENRRDRNQFLMDLATQLQSGALSSPFDQEPPDGPLHYPDDEDGTSSWLDISEVDANSDIGTITTTTTMMSPSPGTESGDSPTPQLQQLPKPPVGAKLKADGIKLKHKYVRKYIESVNAPAVDKGKEDSAEIIALRAKIKDLNEVKSSLKTAQSVTEEWKTKFNNLLADLQDKEQESKDLRSTIDRLQSRVLELEKSESETKRNLTQEIDSLRSQLHSNVYKYEIEIKRLTESKDAVIRDKEEIEQKLSKEIEDNRLNQERIIMMKNSITKTEKLLHKTERDAQRRTEKLNREFEVREQAMQMQLRHEQMESILRHNAMKKAEYDEIIKGLENKYVSLAQNLQIEAMEARRNSDDVILGLRQLLDKTEISFKQ